jgi:uncharacterized protein YdgA (DUF945 family)
MRKWLIGLAAVVIIILLLPLGFGLHADSVVNQLDGKRIPLKNGEFGTVEFTVTDVQRGWWSSTATINLNYIESPLLVGEQSTVAQTNPEAAETTPTSTSNEPAVETLPAAKTLLVSKVHIVHGPILWRSNETTPHPFFGQAWFKAPVDYVAENFPKRFLDVTGIETGELVGYIGLLGKQIFYASTNEISFQDAGGQLNFSGFNLEVERASSGKQLALDLAIPHFNFMLYPTDNTVGQDGTRWLMDGIELKFDGNVDDPAAFWYGTWFGDALLSINSVQIEAEGERYALNRLTTQSSQKAGTDTTLLDGKAHLKVENVNVNEQLVGPVELGVSYTNLDRDALTDIRKLHEAAISAHPESSFFSALTPAEQEQFFNDLFKLVNRLPSYNIDTLSIGTPTGTVNGDFSFKVTAPAHQAGDLQTLGYWQQSVDANIDLDVTQVLAQDIITWGLKRFYKSMNPLFKMPSATPEPNANDTVNYQSETLVLLEQAQMFGVINKQDNDYVLGASYQEGLLTINGKSIFDFSNKQAEKTENNSGK